MRESKSGENIEEIIKRINAADSGSDPVADGEVEFDFGSKRSGGGLVFEFVKLEEQAPSLTASEREEKPSGDVKPEEKTPEAAAKPLTTDVFSAAERSESFPVNPLDASGSTKIWTTYVPRFTEVSENYRMASEPRPSHSYKAPQKNVELLESEPKELDPTAEMDEAVDGAVIVKMDKPTEEPEVAESISVYKFSGGEAEEKPRQDADEKELEEINRLLTKEEPVTAEEPEPVDEPVALEEPEAREEAPEPREYTIPDPVDGDIRVLDYDAPRSEPALEPGGVIRTIPDAKKKRGGEFTLPIQRDGFKDAFLDSLMSLKIRLGAAIVFSLVLFAFEMLYSFGALREKIFSLPVTPIIPIVIDILFISAAFAVALPEVVRSVKYCMKGKPMPELMLPVSFAALVAYFFVLASNPAGEQSLFGFMFSVLPVSAILASYYRTSANFTAFKQISKNAEKQILDKRMTRELPEENLALDGIVDEYKSQSARFFRASFITDFFKKSVRTSEKPVRTAILLAVPFGVALVTAAVAFFLMDGIVSAMSVLCFVLLLSSPVFAILSHKLSYSDAQKAALDEESTAVGEVAYDDFSAVDVIAFDDTEIFGPDDVNLKRFMLYGDRDNMEKAMRQMCSLFSIAGGPLNYIFAGALDNRVRHAPAGNPVIEEDGLSGDVGGRRISAGSEAYMLRHGIAIPEGSSTVDVGIDTTKIMYAAEDGEVYAKFYIRYSFSEEFTMLLPSLKEQGIVPLVYTRDPNISNELLKTLTAGADCMRVMKKQTPKIGDEPLYSRVSADIVTYGEKINAISTVIIAKKYKKLVDRFAASEIYAMAAGGVLALLLTLLDMHSAAGVILGLWHIAWCIVLHFVSRRTLLGDRISEKKEKKKEK